MSRSRFAVVTSNIRKTGTPFFVLFLLALTVGYVSVSALATEAELPPRLPQAPAVPAVTLRAVSGATIEFWTRNGNTVGNDPPQALAMPHLVLYRNDVLTAAAERTLIVEVTGIELPTLGVLVTLELETQHQDPDLRGKTYATEKISVWRESQQITSASGSTQAGVTAVFTIEFDGTVLSGNGAVAMPTDYFRYQVTVTDADNPLSDPLYTFAQDYAFLMERQWVAQLPEVAEESAGAAPDELIVTYCDMFPFQESRDDVSTRLPRQAVPGYIRTELAPRMVEAFSAQTDDWGFPWSQAWTAFRPGEDEDRLSVALTDGRTWFHGQAPTGGTAAISINVNGSQRAHYPTLTDGLMSTFHHELFHNLQRNIQQQYGGGGDVDGADAAWRFFSEGTAALASSVGQPVIQFSQTFGARNYMSSASQFVASRGLAEGDLNRSAGSMSPYHAALYWRFLYEQCGGAQDGHIDPAEGMQVISRTLVALYSGEIIDISSSSDFVEHMPGIMDRALAGATCPFKTHGESLIAFARAIYALRLDGGRCTEPGRPAGCGFYDPRGLYPAPPVSTLTYTGASHYYKAGIESSFGMDFIELELDTTANGQALTLEFYGAPGADAEFHVQLWKQLGPGSDNRPQSIAGQSAVTEVLSTTRKDGRLTYVIPAIDTTEYNTVALIVTRLDAKEHLDPSGEYTIVLRAPRASVGGDNDGLR